MKKRNVKKAKCRTYCRMALEAVTELNDKMNRTDWAEITFSFRSDGKVFHVCAVVEESGEIVLWDSVEQGSLPHTKDRFKEILLDILQCKLEEISAQLTVLNTSFSEDK